MTSGVKFRLAALGVAVAVMGVLIAFATLYSQRQSTAVYGRLSEVVAQSVGLADRFRSGFREANDKLTRYERTGEASGWSDFQFSSAQLGLLIQGQTADPLVPREKDILVRMNSAYADFHQAAVAIHRQILASGPANALPPEMADKLSQARRNLFDSGQDLSEAHLELRGQFLTEAGQMLLRLRVTVLAALVLIFLFGIALAVLVYRDMIAPLRSELVETQAVVVQREKLASLGLLAAGVAHEIRNPLTAIKAALFTQQKKFAAGSPEHSDVKVVEREILRLERIVSDFLQFARPAEPEPVVIAADALLLETKIFFEPQLEKNKIRLALEPSTPLHIRVDPAQMKQVLINLVQNAADSIGHDGVITMRAHQSRKPLLNGESSTVILEVADTGRGIPPDVQKRLFDPFFTTKENGTGLGLSIAARIVQKHGGVLQYQTQVNHGATFGILLPPANP